MTTSATNMRQPDGFRLTEREQAYIDFLHSASMARKHWFFRLNKAPFILALLLILFLYAGPLLRQWDITSAVPDTGVLVVLLLVVIFGLAMVLAAGWFTRRLFARHAGFDQEDFSQAYFLLAPWKQVTFYLACYVSLFWGLIVLLSSAL